MVRVRGQILELLPLIVDLGYKVLDAKLVQANTFATCIVRLPALWPSSTWNATDPFPRPPPLLHQDIFYSNPFNNFIHHGVNNFLMNALTTQRQALIDEERVLLLSVYQPAQQCGKRQD